MYEVNDFVFIFKVIRVINILIKNIKKFSSKLIGIGILIPAILSLYFIVQFGITTVYWDEWVMVPILKEFFTGGDVLSHLTKQHNEHIPFFPSSILLVLAYFTAYNVIFELLVGWIFLSLTVYVLWRLLNQTVPEARWLIIPMAWLTFSFSQYETMLWGYTSLQWYLLIFSVITAIYFLNKIKYSPSSLFPALILGFVGTFSLLGGLLFWLVGFANFRGKFSHRKKMLLIYSIIAISTFMLFSSWDIPAHHRTSPLSSLDNPLSLIKYSITYLGNPPQIILDTRTSESTIIIGTVIGFIILSLFFVMSLFFCRTQVRKRYNDKLLPWFQIAFFGFLSAIITGIGRLSFGEQTALSSRYVPAATLFWEGTLIITAVLLLYMIKSVKTTRNQNILKTIFVILLIFLSFSIGLSYYFGWVGGSNFSNRISVGSECLLTFESATDDCLSILYPDPDFIRKNAKILHELCLGPLSVRCT